MRSYLSVIPISAKVRRRQNRMTLLCTIFAVFLVTAVFSMADMGIRMEQARLAEKHAREFNFQAIMDTGMGQNLFLLAGGLFILILLAGVLMISGSINSTVAQRTKFFGMMRCIGMSRHMNSISMSVSAKSKQYGAMRAVGMDESQVTRMIATEAVTYALSGCVIGCIVGLAASRMLYNLLIDGRFPYAVWTLPVSRLLIVLAFVAAATLAAIYAPAKRIRNMAITAAINEL